MMLAPRGDAVRPRVRRERANTADRGLTVAIAAAAILCVALDTGSCARLLSGRTRVRGRFGRRATRARNGSSVILRNVTPWRAEGSDSSCSEAASIFSTSLQMRREFLLGVARHFDGGELPHAREQHVVVRAGIADQDRAPARIAQNRRGDAHFHGRAFTARRGNFARQVARASAGTSAKPGTRRSAESAACRLSRRVPSAPGSSRRARSRASRFCARSPSWRQRAGARKIAANGAETREHARDVAVEDGERTIVGDAEDGRGRVAPDAGQRERRFERARELAVVAGDDFFRRAMQVARAAVVAEAGPSCRTLSCGARASDSTVGNCFRKRW